MRRHYPSAVATAFLILIPLVIQPSFAQDGSADRRPVPRLPDGTISFGAPPGEQGVWNRGDYRSLVPERPEEIALRDGRDLDAERDPMKPLVSEVPFQPWAKDLWLYRQTHEIEPYTRCKPAGGFRNMASPYGTEIVQVPDEQRLYIFQTGGPHSFRPIYLDGRPHPEDLDPSYYGHSVGHWEDDTLVVDTVGFNERGWLGARGIPTTKQLHLVERFTRLDFDTLRYEMTVDDPGAYTGRWTTGMDMRWTPGREQFEYICQDGNLASQLMIGGGNTLIDRTSPIVP